MPASATLAERRKALGLSRMKLAARLGLDQTTIWRYETRSETPPWYVLAIEALEYRSVMATHQKL